MPQSKDTCTSIQGQLATGEKFLFVTITLDCPICGGVITYTIPGHHLRAVRDMVIQEIDRYPDPELTGKDGGLRAVERLSLTPPSGGRPEDN